MKYFLDTEFIEGTQSSWFGRKTKPTIDLISIGIVAEDSREYYAISKDFNLKEAWNRYDLEERSKTKTYWIRENVLKPIYNELLEKEVQMIHKFNKLRLHYDTPYNSEFCYKTLKYLVNLYGKDNQQIASEIIDFCDDNKNTRSFHLAQSLSNKPTNPNYRTIEFYTYYGAYDWVVFCWLFGKMIDLPKDFPMFSIDLKVMLDDKLKSKITLHSRIGNVHFNADKINSGDYSEVLSWTKGRLDYPKQENEHNALDDAKWNKKLYEFIKQL